VYFILCHYSQSTSRSSLRSSVQPQILAVVLRGEDVHGQLRLSITHFIKIILCYKSLPSGKCVFSCVSEERAASNFKVINVIRVGTSVIQVHSASLGRNDLLEVEFSVLIFCYKFPDEL